MIIKDFSPCACTLTYFTYSHCGAKFRNKHICYVFFPKYLYKMPVCKRVYRVIKL